MSERGSVSGRMGLDPDQSALCAAFLAWQCRIRQMAVRHDGGRPSSGMRPHLELPEGSPPVQVTVLIVEREPEESTSQFRHLVLKTQDPRERYESALRVLAAAYYQHPERFSDQLTALFNPDSVTCRRLLEQGRCVLDFEQWHEGYRLPCVVRALDEQHPAFQAVYWHNRLFNPMLQGTLQGVSFLPDWSAATHHSDAA